MTISGLDWQGLRAGVELETGNIPGAWHPVREHAVFDKERPFEHLTEGARSFWTDLYDTHVGFGIDPEVPAP